MDVLVVGGTGTTGRRVTQQLLAAGHRPHQASRTPADSQVRFDWGDPASHREVVTGVDAVYLVPPSMVEDATPVISPFLELANESGIGRVVLLSSQAAGFPDEPEDSGRTRLEKLVERSDLRWTIIRPTGFAQNFSEGFLLPGILQANTVATASGDGAVAFVDADDIARVAVAALVSEDLSGQILEVTGPEPLTFDEAAQIVADVSGRTIAHRALPPTAMAEMLESNGVPSDYVTMLLRDMEATRVGHSARVTATVEDISGGPAVPFADFARGAAEAWSQPAPTV
jgi:uncharacterized protein YbjT (DUF2867 family)